jgi:hypothetical protein
VGFFHLACAAARAISACCSGERTLSHAGPAHAGPQQFVCRGSSSVSSLVASLMTLTALPTR